MDFGALPPEINSARMYSGPGSGPLLAAATGWDGLAAELDSAATSYGAVIGRMTALSWHGPASASMAAAAARYVDWMNTAAAQAEQTANQARAAAAAYEAAFSATVPPPVIAANRSLLLSLIATNILGQNTPAIAATEAQYAGMWAQDAAAMYGYAGSSAAAATLFPFTPPQQTTNPAGLAAQGAVVAQTTSAGTATNIQATLTQLTSTLPTALQGLASPLSSTSATTDATTLLNLVAPALSVGTSSAWVASSALFDSSQLVTLSSSGSAAAGLGAAPAAAAAAPLAGGLGSAVLTSSSAGLANFGGAGMGAAVSAGTGRAALVGSLSVPQTWTDAAPMASTDRAAALAGTGLGAAPSASEHAPGMLAGLPSAGPAGRGIPAALPDPRFLERPAMVPRWSTVG
jgi:PPE-repeat protein